MNRRDFTKLVLGGVGLFAAGKGLMDMGSLDLKEKTTLMPSVFIGHGSPMNLIEINGYTNAMSKLGQNFKPKAILAISAHWLTDTSIIQNAPDQQIVYDFTGFPRELYEINYPARGWHGDLIKEIEDIGMEGIRFTARRGLDHGTWAVLHHMYPESDVPVIQLSIPRGLSLSQHFQIGQKLGKLRAHGVMIMGSGNIVHNLYKIDWHADAPPAEWATQFDKKVEKYINERAFEKLLTIDTDERELFGLAHPTPEHYIPLAYALGASFSSDNLFYPCNFIQNGSVSMRSVVFG